MNTAPMLAPDAAMVLGIAATAIPFARTPEDQAERWLRVLRLHGEVGAALQALGVSEQTYHESGVSSERVANGAVTSATDDIVESVGDRAARIASGRHAAGVATTDVLLAVMQVYGADFERVLRGHGTDSDEVLARLDVELPEPAEA